MIFPMNHPISGNHIHCTQIRAFSSCPSESPAFKCTLLYVIIREWACVPVQVLPLWGIKGLGNLTKRVCSRAGCTAAVKKVASSNAIDAPSKGKPNLLAMTERHQSMYCTCLILMPHCLVRALSLKYFGKDNKYLLVSCPLFFFYLFSLCSTCLFCFLVMFPVLY